MCSLVLPCCKPPEATARLSPSLLALICHTYTTHTATSRTCSSLCVAAMFDIANSKGMCVHGYYIPCLHAWKHGISRLHESCPCCSVLHCKPMFSCCCFVCCDPLSLPVICCIQLTSFLPRCQSLCFDCFAVWMPASSFLLCALVHAALACTGIRGSDWHLSVCHCDQVAVTCKLLVGYVCVSSGAQGLDSMQRISAVCV